MPGPVPEWLRLQRKIFSRWVAQKLWMSKHIKVDDIVTSLQTDPTILIHLIEVLTEKPYEGKLPKLGKMRVQLINAANDVLKFVFGSGVQMKIKTSAEDIIDGDEKNVLALVFSILQKFMKFEDDGDGPQLSAKDALLMWLQNKTAGYEGVSVTNLTTSLHSGLALCALINKFRPQLIDYKALPKDDKMGNIKRAMDAAEKYFGLEQYITPAEFLKLDECGMLVYVSEYFYGIAEQRKIDQAARRVQKVVKFTKAADAMRAEFADESTKFLERLKKVEKVLEDRTIDNTMAGAKKKLEEFYKYKTEDKNVILGYQLNLESLFNNLSMLLVQNNRPPFVPPAGLSLKDIEASMVHLEQVEQERKVALHAELNRQIRLAALDENHKSLSGKLEAYGKQKLEYLGHCHEGVESIGAAQFALKSLDTFDKESANVRASQVADLIKLGAELEQEKYEHIADVKAREASINEKFDMMAKESTVKRPILDDHLARELFREDLRLKGVFHGKRYEKLNAWCTEKDAYLATREEIHSVADAQLNIRLLDNFDADLADQQPHSVVPLKELGQAILTAEYKTQYSEYRYNLPDEIKSHEAAIDEFWARLTEHSREKNAYLEECLAREQKKEELRVAFAEAADDSSRFCSTTIDNMEVALFGFNLEEVEAYAKEVESSTAAINATCSEKKGVYEGIWNEMQSMNFSDNPYTSFTLETLAQTEDNMNKAVAGRNERYQAELARQRANDALCKEFAAIADPLAQWVVSTKDTITNSKEKLREQLKFVEAKIASLDKDGASLPGIVELQKKMDEAGITNNRHTLLTAKDCEVLWEQYQQFVNKKKTMLENEIQNEELRGITPEQMTEIESNFKQFDKDGNGTLDGKEIKACLYSLGEEVLQSAINKLLAEYGDGKGCMNLDGFKRYMIHLLGDTDSKEDVLSGWALIAQSNEVVTEERMSLTCSEEVTEYVKGTAPKKGNGYDFVAWTDDVFSR